MPLPAGTRIGSYEVLSLLGEGGMGQVYRARDHTLGRDVALKVISGVVADDPDRLARFRREAQVLAALNHPNIAHIYGFEDGPSGSGPALVLELVEGPTLADRLGAGPVPVEEALAIARQIADALTVAHERGIVHRDLKPANIKLRDSNVRSADLQVGVSGVGTVKILDFGLAKALVSDSSASASPMNSPTLTARGTEIGVILGTAAYMSPEQARGKPVDRRADVWAFGVVLYEMLTGRRAFQGPEISDVLASVLKESPPLDALPADTPASVRRLLRRALEKDPVRRLDSMTAARLELDDADAAPVVVRDARAPARRLAVPIAAAILLTAFGTGAAVWYALRPPAPDVVRLSLTPAADQPIAIETNHADIAITPDGRRIVYFTEAATGGAPEQRNRSFVVRALDQPDGRVISKLPGNARGPFTSADGRWIGFQAGPAGGSGNEIRKVPIDGGASVLICDTDYNLRGSSWAPDNATIVFGTSQAGVGLLQVPAAGGKPEVLTTPNGTDGEAEHYWPHHLPDGEHVLFSILRTDSTWDVALLSLSTRTWRVLFKDGLSPRYVSSGHLVYATLTGLHAVPFDRNRLEVRGDPIEVQPGVVNKESGAADFAVSSTGTLVYLPGEPYAAAEALAWRQPDGRETPLRLSPQPYVSVRVSPDGRRAVALVGRTTTQSLWLIDLDRETSIRLATHDMEVFQPVWHPDSKEIVFGAVAFPGGKEAGGLFRLAVSGTGAPERLTTAQERQNPGSFTPDGTQLLFTDGTRGADADIRMLRYAPPFEVTTLMGGSAIEHSPALSPDGRWLAYVLAENSGPQVFVRPFPNVNETRIPVATGSSQAPVWSSDGGQLYFTQPGGDVMVVRVERPAPITFGQPALFTRTRDAHSEPIRIALPPVNGRVLTTVRPSARPSASTEYRVVLNWVAELKSRVTGR